MAKRIPYENLPLVPSIIADVVATSVYDGCEMSKRVRTAAFVAETEALRKKLPPPAVRKFVALVDDRCRKAYENRAEWFMDLLKAKGNRGRDELYNWVRHWFCSYLDHWRRFGH